MAEATSAASGGGFSKMIHAYKSGEIAFSLAVIGILLVLLFPVPTLLLDFLFAISITASVLILMTCLSIHRPLDLSIFPTILLIAAILRLALNIASTRLILADGHTGTRAAGRVIEAFGSFVMEGNVVIGAIVFAILTIINFVVITKGSGRIAEVAARFSLDAMPGKQMAIDADLSAGLIDEDTARKRRKELEDESTFFGSMDGANKFVRGDAIAGLLITFINFIAGIIIGVVQRNLSFGDALHTYTTLTIGDGLVSQIPALIVSLSAGLLVSKSGAVGTTEQVIVRQIRRYPQAIGLAGVLMGAMALMPGIPAAPFLLLGAAVGTIAWYVHADNLKKAEEDGKEKGDAVLGDAESEESEMASLSETLKIEYIRIELGYALLSLINYKKGNKLTDQIKALRKQLARDLGFVMPSVRILDNMQLPANTYVVRVKDIECGRGELRPDKLLVLDPRGGSINLDGEPTTEPTFGLPAMWVDDVLREEALFRNYTVVDPPTVVTTHLTEVVKDNITELLSYGETQKLLDDIDEEHKKLLTDISPSQISISAIQRILQNLLSEGISIRDLPTILEAIAEVAKSHPHVATITEHVRQRLARQISFAYQTEKGYVPVVALSQDWEELFQQHLIGQGDDRQLSVPPSKLQEFMQRVQQVFEEQALQGEIPVMLVNPDLRPYVRSIVERFRSSGVVLSQAEIHPKVKIKTLAFV